MTPRSTLVLALTSAATACGGGQALDRNADAPGMPETIVVEATNEHFYDVRIHAVWDGGMRRTLGTIPGNGGHTELTMDWEPRPLTFEISFIVNQSAYVSHPVDVIRGDIVEVRIPPNIDESGFFRRMTRR